MSLSPNHQQISQLVSKFASDLTNVIEKHSQARINAVLATAFNGHNNGHSNGRSAKATTRMAEPAVKVAEPAAAKPKKAARRKMPPQFCPSPGCSNKAVPAFNMLCVLHKNAPKTMVSKWREARRAAKLAASSKNKNGKGRSSKSKNGKAKNKSSKVTTVSANKPIVKKKPIKAVSAKTAEKGKKKGKRSLTKIVANKPSEVAVAKKSQITVVEDSTMQERHAI